MERHPHLTQHITLDCLLHGYRDLRSQHFPSTPLVLPFSHAVENSCPTFNIASITGGLCRFDVNTKLRHYEQEATELLLQSSMEGVTSHRDNNLLEPFQRNDLSDNVASVLGQIEQGRSSGDLKVNIGQKSAHGAKHKPDTPWMSVGKTALSLWLRVVATAIKFATRWCTRALSC